jgi:hypothetical protein
MALGAHSPCCSVIVRELRNERALSREVRLDARLLVPAPDAMVIAEVAEVEVVEVVVDVAGTV